MAKDLNRAELIGRLTRDPELRYTPSGSAVCSFSIATNRNWTTDAGEKREEVDFHNIVSWNKLAEICSQYLTKGKRVFVEGRLTTRSWTSQDGQQKTRTEIVINDMIMLDGRGAGAAVPGEGGPGSAQGSPLRQGYEGQAGEVKQKAQKPTPKQKQGEQDASANTPVPTGNADEEVSPDDIPF